MATPDRIAALTAQAIADATRALVAGGTPGAWERAMRDAITRGHTAAAIAGTAERGLVGRGRAALARVFGERALPREVRDVIVARVAGQLPYLQQFAAALPTLSDAQIAARAGLYAGAVRATYYEARNYGWDLRDVPIPADGGTQCLSNCKCVAFVEEAGGRAVWVYETTAAEHCPECLSRAARSPYPLRRIA